MTDTNLNSARNDKTLIDVISLRDLQKAEQGDREYWLSKTPQQRLAAMELMRQINYGYDPATTRLQRVLEIAQLERS